MTETDLNKLADLIAMRILSTEECLDKAQASAYSKIGQKRLIKLAKQGDIKGYPDPDNKDQWIFLKSSLKQYRRRQIDLYSDQGCEDDEDEKVISQIMKASQ